MTFFIATLTCTALIILPQDELSEANEGLAFFTFYFVELPASYHDSALVALSPHTNISTPVYPFLGSLFLEEPLEAGFL
ncbi:hypothetical protein CPB83DRAFT_843360, partial [Crepidotus variabilis]